jgi:hypothetical protein
MGLKLIKKCIEFEVMDEEKRNNLKIEYEKYDTFGVFLSEWGEKKKKEKVNLSLFPIGKMNRDFTFIKNEREARFLYRYFKKPISAISEITIDGHSYTIVIMMEEENILFNRNIEEPYEVKLKILGIKEILEAIYVRDKFEFSSHKPSESDYWCDYDAYLKAEKKYEYRKEKAKEIHERKLKERKQKLQDTLENKLLLFEDNNYYIYHQNLYAFSNIDHCNDEEKKLFIKQHYFKHEKKFQKIQNEIKLFEKLLSIKDDGSRKSREPISEEVRFAVWRRDGGKCIQCGNKEKLEFDHIIPISRGGSNTERNIQLLCEKCNREKSAKI